MLAGYFTKPYIESWGGVFALKQFIKKKFDRLIIPYLVSYGLLILWSLIPAICKHDWHMPVRHLLSVLWGGYTSMGYGIFGPYFEGIRISYMWFLLALFWGLLALYLLSKWPKILLMGGFLISISACVLYPYIGDYVPWNILQGLGAMQFLAIGHWLRSHKLPQWVWWICIVCWLVEIYYSGISMAFNAYSCYPLDVLGALGGTYCLYWFSYGLSKLRFMSRVLLYIGSISMAVLCFHTIEPLTDIFISIRIRSAFFMQLPDLIWVGIRYCAVLVSAIIFTKLPFFRKIYH